MEAEIVNLRNQAIARISEAESTQDLEQIRAFYLGKQGALTKLIKGIKHFDSYEKKQIGILVNETKNTINEFLSTQSDKLNQKKPQLDTTVPGIKPQIGHLHLVTQAINEISSIFERQGFARSRYPEVEWDWFSFGALNFGPDHPARDDWETFFVDTKPHPKYGQMLLTPHTSSGQIREMLRTAPPIRMINIGKTYRRQTDISHVPVFHQFEGLVVDTNITIAQLKSTLDNFAKEFFGANRTTRLRPYHFPFTEPSFEVDITCGICNGEGCKLCKAGWLELGGAGMVHPNVLKSGGIDPTKYTGFAFGWGVERVMMMKEDLNIPDVRMLYSLDLRYLTQF
jgi:phenylalanyl-tRNA synthetase alpha chain